MVQLRPVLATASPSGDTDDDLELRLAALVDARGIAEGRLDADMVAGRQDRAGDAALERAAIGVDQAQQHLGFERTRRHLAPRAG